MLFCKCAVWNGYASTRPQRSENRVGKPTNICEKMTQICGARLGINSETQPKRERNQSLRVIVRPLQRSDMIYIQQQYAQWKPFLLFYAACNYSFLRLVVRQPYPTRSQQSNLVAWAVTSALLIKRKGHWEWFSWHSFLQKDWHNLWEGCPEKLERTLTRTFHTCPLSSQVIVAPAWESSV